MVPVTNIDLSSYPHTRQSQAFFQPAHNTNKWHHSQPLTQPTEPTIKTTQSSSNVNVYFPNEPTTKKRITTTTGPIIVDACGRCGNTVFIDHYWTGCGIALCILLFPIGIACLFLLKQKKCDNCGQTYDSF